MGTLPAHLPVLAQAAVELLACSPGKVVVDATIGGGGHAELILERIGQTGHLIGIDWDHKAIELVRERLRSTPNLTLIRENFRDLATIVNRIGHIGIDALLLDLGLSSFQIEEAARGISFTVEGPLDMRMDMRLKTTAADIINTYTETEIARLLSRFGEEPNARRIAKAIVRERAKKPLCTTTALAHIIRSSVAPQMRRARIDPVTKSFQALRIEVNAELDNLRNVLSDAIPLLKPKGRICVISFHSLEDRIVKRAFVRAARGCVCPPDLPRCACGKEPVLRILTPKPLRPSTEEIAANPRSRSARLRAAEKVTQETIS
jgi:16S rRNA (cytosine1402-N4)-methyltransferase